MATTTKQWELYRDNDDIELVGSYHTKNEGVDAVNWANDETVVFSYNALHNVWDAGDYTLTKVGHPQLKANRLSGQGQQEAEN